MEKILVGLSGASGAMGGEVLLHLLKSNPKINVKILLRKKYKQWPKFLKNTIKKYKNRVEIISGDLLNYEVCEDLIKNIQYMIHCGAIIPPASDHNPKKTEQSNFIGTKNIVDAINNTNNADKIKLVHISTMGLYGNRTYKHPWGRVGDPLIPSDYDYYSVSKMKAEKYVLESGLKYFVSLRQTGVAHKYILKNNLSDGLIFHSAWNSPIEWVSDVDSGIMCANLVNFDLDNKLDGFWRRVYNVGGGFNNRVTGYENLNYGFKIIGRGAKKFFRPNWNITRNFHGMWFLDSFELNDYLHFQNESFEEFWKRLGRRCWYLKLGKICPPSLISKFIIKPLFKNTNAPMYWIKNNKTGRINAFFGSLEKYNKIPTNWKEYHLICEGKLPTGEKIDYNLIRDEKYARENGYVLNHGYDETKSIKDLNIEDLKMAAKYRGGKCVSDQMNNGELYEKLVFECHDGHRFEMMPYTILFGGYWCPVCSMPTPWAFGKLAKVSPFHGQIYYDDHNAEEEAEIYPKKESDEEFILKLR